MNDGVAFGITLGAPALVVVLILLVLAGLVAYFARRPTRPFAWLATGLVLGGALSNIYDRVRAGSVTDFIKLPLGWPPFNVADMCVTVGVVGLALIVEGGARRAAR
jgi:signal peptidase II